jgi:hypothetical protein
MSRWRSSRYPAVFGGLLSRIVVLVHRTAGSARHAVRLRAAGGGVVVFDSSLSAAGFASPETSRRPLGG